MSVKLYLSEDENPRKALWWMFKILLLAVVCLVVAMAVFLSWAHLLQNGINEYSLSALERFFSLTAKDPLSLFRAYGDWFEVFKEAVRRHELTAALLLPLTAPLLFLLIVFLAYVKSSYALMLWYVLHNHFAKLKDVRRMGLLNGKLLALGRFQNLLLSLKQPLSVLCFGPVGSGKTSAVAIPSVLNSDNACVIAVDRRGNLAKYTSGYRAQIGRVFYFNWDLCDDAGKDEFYPRFNPLSRGNLPPRGEGREYYLSLTAKNLVAADIEVNKDNYWEWLAYSSMAALLNFFVTKTEQAAANDYFLDQIIKRGTLGAEDRDVLLSYYGLMPQSYAARGLQILEKKRLKPEEYLPIGSWGGIPEVWKGKEACLPMFADWLFQSYFAIREGLGEDGREVDVWKILFGNLLDEARFMNYGTRVIDGIRQMVYLSRKQRSIILPLLMKPLTVFKQPSIRERMSSSDFYYDYIHGVRHESGSWQPVTVYTLAATKPARFVNRFFLDMLIAHGLQAQEAVGPLPLLMVLDDLGQMPKLKFLQDGLNRGAHHNMSFLMMSDDLTNLERIYGKSGLEEMVSVLPYKLLLADSNRLLSQQLNKLAVYGTASVQIPAEKKGAWFKAKGGFSDAYYYHKIAKRLLSRRRRMNVVTRGYQLLLAEGYYHLPVLTKSTHFLRDETLCPKSTADVDYFLHEDFLAKRHIQDQQVPGLDGVLAEIGIHIDNEEAFGSYISQKYQEAIERMADIPDRKTVLADDLSAKWQSHGEELAKEAVRSERDREDWWLAEDSFSLSIDAGNPFERERAPVVPRSKKSN